MAPLAVVAGPGIGEPFIRAIEQRDRSWTVRVSVPTGVARVVLESCRRNDLKAWIPVSSARVNPGETELGFSTDGDAPIALFRVRAEAVDPLPAPWYQGIHDFPPRPAAGSSPFARDREDADADADAGVGRVDAAGGEVPVRESDIWTRRGDRLCFFNAARGLQIIDLANPDAPRLKTTLRIPGSGEQLYLPDDRHAVLLVHDPCRQWGTDAESAVWVVDTQTEPPVTKVRLPVKGRIVKSRWVGAALYVATETWEAVNDGSGNWIAGTRVASFDFSNVSEPVPRRPLWVPGSGNVVSATDRFFFVAVTDYSKSWPWATDLEVFDITPADGTVDTWVRIPLAGRLSDESGLDVWNDTLRVVVESVEGPDTERFMTVLESYRLTDPRAMSPLPVARLDRLELSRGERLFATRFDGARAYSVTTASADPLWVLDLSNPADLRVAGEVDVPSRSTYLHPMGDRLLTLGVDDGSGSRVALQWFDVADPTKPRMISKATLGEAASWSEANQDENAVGVFPDSDLLLIPVSEWGKGGATTGVRLVDMKNDVLRVRGFLASEGVVPRRAIIHGDRVMAFSGHTLMTAEMTDRDAPIPKGVLELSYPVDRILAIGEYLLEFHDNSVRVRRSTEPEGGISTSLGDLPVLGACHASGRMHLLQGRGAEITWEPGREGDGWMARTNAGSLVASVWDTGRLPALVRLGESSRPTDAVALGDARAAWPKPGLLVWALADGGQFPWRPNDPTADPAIDPSFGPAGLGWGAHGRRLVPVSLGADETPLLHPERPSGSGREAVGDVFAARGLVFSSHRVMESEVVGTNWIVEAAWFPAGTIRDAKEIMGADGKTTTLWISAAAGEWRPVTNAYPVLRWWSRHELDVWDYSRNPDDPVRRPSVPIPGAVEGIAHDGRLLFMSSARQDPATGMGETWLEAGAYDEIVVHRVDAIPIANEKRSELARITTRGESVYVARASWERGIDPKLEVWRLDTGGRWARQAEHVPPVVTGDAIGVIGDVLLVTGAGRLAAYPMADDGRLSAPASLEMPGCFSPNLLRADGDAARGIWLPGWDYGAIAVGP